MSGFYSKDAIVESMLFTPRRLIAVVIVLMSIFMTRVYSGRFFFLSSLSSRKVLPVTRLKEPLRAPLFTLGSGAVIAGLIVVRLVGPFGFEPFNPFYKYFLIALMVAGVFGFCRVKFCDSFNISRRSSRFLFFSSRSSIILLTPVTTQEILTSSS